MRETTYQRALIAKLETVFPDCVVLRNDPKYIQGIPDLLVLFGDRWAALEVKMSEDAPVQPNQDYFVHILNERSYATFIFPENEQEVFDELQQSFGNCR